MATGISDLYSFYCSVVYLVYQNMFQVYISDSVTYPGAAIEQEAL